MAITRGSCVAPGPFGWGGKSPAPDGSDTPTRTPNRPHSCDLPGFCGQKNWMVTLVLSIPRILTHIHSCLREATVWIPLTEYSFGAHGTDLKIEDP